jgi:hypothetical protein
MKQFNLIYPMMSDNLVIYNGNDSKEIAMKIFKKLVKKFNDIRICLQDNETKKFIYYVGTTKENLNKYESLFKDIYPNKKGGAMINSSQNISSKPMPVKQMEKNQFSQNSNSIQDRNFIKNINSVADNLAFSAQEIGKLINEKYKPNLDPSEKLLYLVETGLTKIDNVNANLLNISNDLSILSNKITSNTTDNEINEDNVKSKNCIIM